MKVFTLTALDSEPSDPYTFVGRARLTRMNDAAAHPHTNIYRVAFEVGARTNWHSHTGPQLLQIIEGTCRFQTAGAPVHEAAVGDLISFDAGGAPLARGGDDRSDDTHRDQYRRDNELVRAGERRGILSVETASDFLWERPG